MRAIGARRPRDAGRRRARALVQRRRQRGAAARRRARRARGARRRRAPIEFRGEFLHAFLEHRARALAPAGGRARRAAAEVRADAMEYDNLDRVVQLQGPRARRCSRRAHGPRQGLNVAAPPLVFITGASSGIGQALARAITRRLAARAGRARAAPSVQAWAACAGLDAGARCAVYARRRARRRRASSRPAAPASRRRACPTSSSPTPASASASTPPSSPTSSVMRATFETNNLGMAATFQPFVRADVRARRAARWSASPASPASAACPATAPTAPARRRVISYCESLRGECRPTA